MIYENWVPVELHVAHQPAKPIWAVQTMPNESNQQECQHIRLEWLNGEGRTPELWRAKRGHSCMTTLTKYLRSCSDCCTILGKAKRIMIANEEMADIKWETVLNWWHVQDVQSGNSKGSDTQQVDCIINARNDTSHSILWGWSHPECHVYHGKHSRQGGIVIHGHHKFGFVIIIQVITIFVFFGRREWGWRRR